MIAKDRGFRGGGGDVADYDGRALGLSGLSCQ